MSEVNADEPGIRPMHNTFYYFGDCLVSYCTTPCYLCNTKTGKEFILSVFLIK